MKDLQVVALTHKKIEISRLGQLFLSEEKQKLMLPLLKKEFRFSEFMLLCTCNRIEFILVNDEVITQSLFNDLLHFLFPDLDQTSLRFFSESAEYFSGEDAVSHLFSVSAGLDSMVVGEREIITQIRKAFEFCVKAGITGDTIRIVVQQAIITAKEIYTTTEIAKNPVSVVSLAYRKLKEFNVPQNARFVLVGAGETISTMAQYLKKHQYANFYIYNRTLSRANQLAVELEGKAFSLNDLKNHKDGFDVLITCTSSDEPLITKEIYEGLLGMETDRKTIVDLAVPGDVDEKVISDFNLNFIDISVLQKRSKENRSKREKELVKCRNIIENRITEFRQLYRERALEVALSDLPRRVKEIRETAVKEVFAKQIEQVDENSRKLIEDLMSYMEKKYNAVTMKAAKESLLESKQVKNVL
ncbi:MAG: glutamyl-tRNA reductase [Bacteroidota bacterium]|jgi:glutamyl-tRNA reductase